jgi:hypothetical protein
MHPRASSASDREVMAASQMLPPGLPSTSEDLHAWSIYRQNLNSDFTDSALGSSEKSPMPYGNFHLRETTMQSIINNPKYGPKSELGTNMYTYLKFGLPRVMAPNRSENPNSSGYDSTDDDLGRRELRGGGTSRSRLRAARSEDILDGRDRTGGGRRRGNNRAGAGDTTSQWSQRENRRGSRLKSSMSEANLLNYDSGGGGGLRRGYRSNGHLNTFVNRGLVDELEQDYDDDVNDEEDEDEMERRRSNHRGGGGRMSKAQSQLSVVSRHSRATHLVDGGVSYRHEAPMLNDKYFPRDYLASGHQNGFHAPPTDHDGFKYPHLQLRNVCFSTKSGDRILDAITMEARGGELMAVMCTKRKLNVPEDFSPSAMFFPVNNLVTERLQCLIDDKIAGFRENTRVKFATVFPGRNRAGKCLRWECFRSSMFFVLLEAPTSPSRLIVHSSATRKHFLTHSQDFIKNRS